MERAVELKIEVGQLIDGRAVSALQIRVIVLCSLLVLLDGYDIQTMALAVPSLAAQWSAASSNFSFALASALFGIALGAAFLAPLGDRWGRSAVMISSLVLVGGSSICTGMATSITRLVVWRFMTGLGLGAGISNAAVLTSEYVPAHRRASLVTLMHCNVALGAFIAGFVAPPIIGAFGWRGIFYAGGFLPLGLCLVMSLTMPESVRFLVARRPEDPRIHRILARLAPHIEARSLYAADRGSALKQSVLELLTPLFRHRTLLLWCIFALNTFVLYLLISWLPTLLRASGWPTAQSLQGAVMIQAGGIAGGLLLSMYIDRGKTVIAMLSAYGAAAVALGLFTVLPSTGGSWWLLLLVIGGGSSGTQFALIALAAAFYPPVIRATGVGWGVSVGRVGGILAPLIGGWIVKQQFATFQILGMLILPVALCGACLFLLPRALKSIPS